MNLLTKSQFLACDIDTQTAEKLLAEASRILTTYAAEDAWQIFSKELLTPGLPFAVHLLLFSQCYPDWHNAPHTAAAWIPDITQSKTTHLAACMQATNTHSVAEFHAWSVKNSAIFWQLMLKKLDIQFKTPSEKICDLTDGIENPHWLVGAKFNIAENCFKANVKKIAVIQQKKTGKLEYFTYGELHKLTNRIANGLIEQGFSTGDAIAVAMPMNFYAVAIYLGIIQMGGIVVSVADSFSPEEIVTRLRITQAKGIFTQDFILRDNKKLPLYEKITAAHAPRAIVLSAAEPSAIALRIEDIAWQDFLSSDDQFTAVSCDPTAFCNILFSSGTTGDPKAIPWTHTTPLKAASDAYLLQDIHEKDILAWPTNLGWMMGPWLIFAALLNHAAIALYEDVPREREFGLFIQDANVTMLGVVPTLVANWRQTQCMQGLNWQRIKCFSSTGECSNPEDMLYLMSLAGYRPIIEYCGGTEIGGAYISSTLLENNYPAVFTTPTMGLNFVLLDEKGQLTDNGEVALQSPSIGLSTQLLNADHHKIYFADMPDSLRRHGDQIQRLALNRYCVMGRVDDTMNLGGIKVSSAEIERVLAGTENIVETAAIAVTPNGHGPACLVIFAATQQDLDKEKVKTILQKKINQHLNPLFKIYDVVFVRELPKTASNKIMRRVLRQQYK